MHVINGIKFVSSLFSSTVLIFDALDEFSTTQRVKLLEVITDLLKSAKFCKAFTTSRPHLRDVHQYLQNTPCIPIKADMLDIRNFLTITTNGRVHGELRSTIIDKLSTSAHGV